MGATLLLATKALSWGVSWPWILAGVEGAKWVLLPGVTEPDMEWGCTPEGVGAGSGKGKFVDGCPPGWTGPPDPGKFPRNVGCAELGGVRDTWSAGVVGVEEVQLEVVELEPGAA